MGEGLLHMQGQPGQDQCALDTYLGLIRITWGAEMQATAKVSYAI